MLPNARAVLLTGLAGLVLILPNLAAAQTIGSTNPLSLSITPSYPVPYGQVTVTPLSDALDLNNVTFVLLVNGKEAYRGNAKPVAVTLAAAGTLTTVKGTISSVDASYTQTISVRPQDVALVAEPASSAPVLYPGKPLIPVDGAVRVVAAANFKNGSGTALDPNTLSYTWTVDGTTVASASGIGKTSVLIDSPLEYRQEQVSVVVMSQDGSLVGGDTITLNAQQPGVRVYENDSLLGIRFDHALTGAYTLSGAETSLFGVPYSFPLVNGVPSLEWFLSGTSAQTGSSITLRPTGSGKGSAGVSFVATAGDSTTASTNLSLTFGAATTNLFGL